MIVLAEKGLWEGIPNKLLEFSKKEHKGEDVLKLNPRGQVSCHRYFIDFILPCLIGLSHIRVSTRVSTAYRDTKGTSHVRRRYVCIRSSYSPIRSSYSSYAEVLRFFMCALKNS